MCTHAHTRARTHAHALPGLRAQQPFSVSLLGRVPLRFRASARSRAPLPLQSQSAAPVAQLRAPREAGARAHSALGPHPAASWHMRSDELIIGSFADDVEGGGRTSGTYPRIRRSERRWPGQRLWAAYTLPFGAGAPQGGLSDELRSAQWTLTQSCLCLCTSSPGAAAAGPPPPLTAWVVPMATAVMLPARIAGPLAAARPPRGSSAAWPGPRGTFHRRWGPGPRSHNQEATRPDPLSSIRPWPNTHTCARTQIYTHGYTHRHTQTTHTYTCRHTHTDVCTHMHTHTQRP